MVVISREIYCKGKYESYLLIRIQRSIYYIQHILLLLSYIYIHTLPYRGILKYEFGKLSGHSQGGGMEWNGIVGISAATFLASSINP